MRNGKIITTVAIILMLSLCSISTFGKFKADKGVPQFIQVGETTKTEVLKTLGEPLFHHIVVGIETLIYNLERGKF